MAFNIPPSSALRLQATESASMKNTRSLTKTPIFHTQRSVSHCRAAQQEGATEDPGLSVSSARVQLDLLEQLTSPTSNVAGPGNATATSRPRRLTIGEQLAAVVGDRDGEFSLPLGKKLKQGLKSLNSLTVSQRRNIRRQALLNKVGGRNDSVFFAAIGAFVVVPPLAILAVAVLTGYVDLLP